MIQGIIDRLTEGVDGNVTFELLQETNIPELYEDEDLLMILFSSLLENSLRVAPQGSIVTIRLKDEVDLLIFTVEDEGPGKTDMDEDIVFDVSRQLVEFENFNVAEIGVGLPMAKRIVEAHGGKIWLLHDEQKKRSGIGFSLRKWF